MGAEGSIVVMPRWQWNEHTGRDPKELGFYTGRILGQEAVWSYYGEPDYQMSPERFAEGDEKTLVEWFQAKAETHEVWT